MGAPFVRNGRSVSPEFAVYARSLMNQPDMIADILAEDRFFYDKGDPENGKRFHEWIAARSSEPYHGGTEPLMRISILEKLGVAGGERLGEKSNNTV